MSAKNSTRRELHIAKARDEALALLRELVPKDLGPAEDYILANPPTAGAIAFLAFVAHDVLSRAEASAHARKPRRNSLREKIRKAGVTKYCELRVKAPALLDDDSYTQKQLIDAISKVKAEKESP